MEVCWTFAPVSGSGPLGWAQVKIIRQSYNRRLSVVPSSDSAQLDRSLEYVDSVGGNPQPRQVRLGIFLTTNASVRLIGTQVIQCRCNTIVKLDFETFTNYMSHRTPQAKITANRIANPACRAKSVAVGFQPISRPIVNAVTRHGKSTPAK